MPGCGESGCGLCGFDIRLIHGDDNIAALVACIDVAVRLDHVFQWIAAVDKCFELSHFNQLFDED